MLVKPAQQHWVFHLLLLVFEGFGRRGESIAEHGQENVLGAVLVRGERPAASAG
jgi:hypothetical protein